MRLIIIYVIWRKNMQIYNLKNKLEYLDEVAKLEYDEWVDNKEENRKRYCQDHHHLKSFI